MIYSIRHVTRFTYEDPISESVMETRMQPIQDGTQHCLHFGLATSPPSRVLLYQDHQGNTVHHFAIPGRHTRLTVTAEAIVECSRAGDAPLSIDPATWDTLDRVVETGEWWDALAPSTFATSTELLKRLAEELDVNRAADPMSLLRRLMGDIASRFEYRPQATRVDSPIDEALEARQGVCQDFAHIFIALARQVGIPCRYVSGYLFHAPGGADRSIDGATHAWAEALLPGLGWVGFDPTNDMVVADRHIRVAIGRDYADVPPTRGVFKGVSAVKSELSVAVDVVSTESSRSRDVLRFVPWMSRDAVAPMPEDPATPSSQHQRQQQQ